MADSSADRNPLDRLAEEFVSRFRAGQRPSLTEYAQRHPDLADDIRDLFPALVEMEQLKPATGDNTGDFATVPEPSDPERVGEFRILRRVGHGGMGVVYEAVQESLGRHVALKLLPSEAVADPKRLERFRREAKAAARLHHTNIVPVFGVGEADRRHYYAMQFIDGHPLDLVIDEVRRLKDKSLPGAPRAVSEVAAAMVTGTFAQGGTGVLAGAGGTGVLAGAGGTGVLAGASSSSNTNLSQSSAFSGNLTDSGRHYWNTVARIGAQVADALAYAHGQGILHRDIKPANLLLDLRGTVWVTDFGLAKAADSDALTHVGDVVGTLRYMAPERFDGPGDARADSYALGLTLYEMLTLKPAFMAENRAKLVQEVTAAAPPTPRSINSSIPRDLETIVLKAIARDPAMRYQSASEMAEDLTRYLEDRPIRARRASRTEQAWRWCRRNPAVAGLLAAVLFILTAGAIVSGLFAVEAEKKEHEARLSAQQAIDAAKIADKEKAEAEEARQQAGDAAYLAKLAAEHATEESKKLNSEQERTKSLLYVSQINHAQAAVNELRTFWAQKALAQTDPRLRGWEWNYLDRITHHWESEVAIPGGEDRFGAASGASFTADGKKMVLIRLVASGGKKNDGLPRLAMRSFDAAAGVPVTNTTAGYPAAASPNNAWAAELRPTPAAGADPDTVPRVDVRVFELRSGATAPLVLPHFEHIRRMWVSDQGDRVTVAAARMIPRGGNGLPQVTDPYLVTARRGSVWPRVREIRSGPDQRLVGTDHLACNGAVAITSFSLGSSGKLVEGLEAPRSRTFEFWDLEPNPPTRLGSFTTNAPSRLVDGLSANGARFALMDGENDVIVFDCRTAAPESRWTLPAELRAARDLAGLAIQRLVVSDDGRRVVLLAGEQTMFVGERSGLSWRSFVLRGPEDIAASAFQIPRGARAGASAIEALWLSPDGNRLQTFDSHQRIRSWNLSANPDYERSWPLGMTLPEGTVLAGRPHEDGRYVVYSQDRSGFRSPDDAGKSDSAVVVRDVFTGGERRIDLGTRPAAPPLVSPDGRRLLESPRSAGGRGNQYRLHSLDGDPQVLWTGSPVESSYIGGRGLGPKLTKGWLVEPILTERPNPFSSGGNGFMSIAFYLQFQADRPQPEVAPTPRPAAPGNGFAAVAGFVRPRGPGTGFGGVPGGARIPLVGGIRFFDPETGRLLAELNSPRFASVEPGGPDGRLALIISRGEGEQFSVQCYEPAARQMKWEWSPEPDAPRKTTGVKSQFPPSMGLDVFQLADGRYTGATRRRAGGSEVWLLDSTTGKEARRFRFDALQVDSVSMGPNGWMMFGAGRTSVVWNMADEAATVRLDGHVQTVKRGVFSADGKRLFTLERDAYVETPSVLRVWDLPGGRLLLSFRIATAQNLWLEGERLMVLCDDGIRVFDGNPRQDEAPVVGIEADYRTAYLPNLPEAEYKAALERAENLKIENPDSQRAWREYGAALFRLNRHKDALAALEKAMTLAGEKPSAPLLAFLAMTRAELGEQEAAGQALTKLQEMLTTRPFTQYLVELAAEAERKVLKPGDAGPGTLKGVSIYDANGSREAFEELLESTRITGSRTGFATLRDRGGAFYRLGRYHEALRTLEQALAFPDPAGSRPAVRGFLAMTEFKLGHAEKARVLLEEFRKAVKQSSTPESPSLRTLQAEAEALIEPKQK